MNRYLENLAFEVGLTSDYLKTLVDRTQAVMESKGIDLGGTKILIGYDAQGPQVRVREDSD